MAAGVNGPDAALAVAVGAAAVAAMAARDSAAARTKPRLGVVVGVSGGTTPDKAIAKVKAFGLKCCQVGVGEAPRSLAGPLKDALAKYQIEATAAMTLGSGKMVWNFYQGPLTIGIVPPQTRAARIDALKRARARSRRSRELRRRPWHIRAIDAADRGFDTFVLG